MFGCGLPVLAKSFAALPELVRSGQNGQVFSSPQELADQLVSLLQGFPDHNHCGLFGLRVRVTLIGHCPKGWIRQLGSALLDQ